MTRKRVGILIFPNVEVLDFCGPFEVFSVARLHEERRREESSPFEMLLLAESIDPVVATGGLRVLPDHRLENCPPLDILVVPGGWGTRREIHNQHVGLLDGRRATTHWRSLDWMRQSFPAVRVEDGFHMVDEGAVMTSAGISAGIDMALLVVTRYFGDTVGRATARHMEYAFPDDNRRRV